MSGEDNQKNIASHQTSLEYKRNYVNQRANITSQNNMNPASRKTRYQ